jgi:SAM-dependent methyltransferase
MTSTTMRDKVLEATTMISTREQVRALVHQLGTATWTLGAIGVAFESGLIEELREPCSLDELATRVPSLSRGRLARCVAVLAASGVVVAEDGRCRLAEGVLPFLAQPGRKSLEGEIRSTIMQASAFLDSARGGSEPGWRHVAPPLLQAQGAASAAFPGMFKGMVVPTLGDFGARLEKPGARFLDVGVGVAGLAIAMCRAFPALEVVGLDPFEAPLAIARENVAREGLADRIDLRRATVEELRDEASFDLAWLPAVFIPEAVLPKAIERIRAALRPGGWVLLPVVGGLGDALQRSVWALQNELWGGPLLSSSGAEELLQKGKLSSVRTIDGPPWAPSLVIGQRM